MIRKTLLACATTLALVAAVPAVAQVFDGPVVTEDFPESGIAWRGVPGGYTFRLTILEGEQPNQLVICGAGQHKDAYTRAAEQQSMRRASITMNDRPILRDLSFFATVSNREPLVGARTRCRAVTVEVPRNARFGLDLPGGRFSL